MFDLILNISIFKYELQFTCVLIHLKWKDKYIKRKRNQRGKNDTVTLEQNLKQE